jgi:hypothetical protein
METEEFTGLRRFLDRLKSGELKLARYGKDVTQEEIAVIEAEIKFLEKVLARRQQ